MAAAAERLLKCSSCARYHGYSIDTIYSIHIYIYKIHTRTHICTRLCAIFLFNPGVNPFIRKFSSARGFYTHRCLCLSPWSVTPSRTVKFILYVNTLSYMRTPPKGRIHETKTFSSELYGNGKLSAAQTKFIVVKEGTRINRNCF